MRIPVIDESRVQSAALQPAREQAVVDTTLQSVGQGLTDLGQGVMGARQAMLAAEKQARERAKAINIADWETERERAKTRAFYNEAEKPEERGLFHLEGEAAFAREAKARDEYKKAIAEIEGRIGDPESRDLFRRRSGADYAATERAVEQYMGRQREVKAAGSLAATQSASEIAILRGWANPEALALEQARVEGLIRAISPKAEADVIAWKSRSTALYLKKNLDEGNLTGVEDYLALHKDVLMPAERGQIEGELRIEKEKNLAFTEAARIAREASNAFGVVDLGKANAELDALKSKLKPDAWKRTKAAVDEAAHAGEQQWKQTTERYFEEGLKGWQGPQRAVPKGVETWLKANDNRGWLALERIMDADREARKRAAAGQDTPTAEQNRNYAKLIFDMAKHPERYTAEAMTEPAFAKEWGPQLHGSQYMSGAKDVRRLHERRREASELASLPTTVSRELIHALEARQLIDSTNPSKMGDDGTAYFLKADADLRTWMAEERTRLNGKEPAAADIKKKILELLDPVETEGVLWGLFGNRQTPRLKANVKGMKIVRDPAAMPTPADVPAGPKRSVGSFNLDGSDAAPAPVEPPSIPAVDRERLLKLWATSKRGRAGQQPTEDDLLRAYQKEKGR